MKRPRPITDAELEVLKVLWGQGQATVRAIAEAVYDRCGETEVGTVHSLLQRLERKRLVERDRGVHPHLFRAAVSRGEVAGRQLEAMADKLADGSMAPFLMHLVQARRLSPQEADQIRRLLQDYETNRE